MTLVGFEALTVEAEDILLVSEKVGSRRSADEWVKAGAGEGWGGTKSPQVLYRGLAEQCPRFFTAR